jgi:hypothetical protein
MEEIVRTKVYKDKGNTQISSGSYSLSINGDLSGKVTYSFLRVHIVKKA